MKLQGLGIVFALIILPLILVLTYYIQLQVDTIALQNKYDAYLLDSTHDAMSSFEINTANEDLSSVSDSLRTIIDASTNVFFSSLATNLGMSNASKAYVEPYVPGLLYTLYDGYYISSPTKVPEVLTDTDGNAVTVGDIGVTKGAGPGEYLYSEIHTTEEQEKNCTVCATEQYVHTKYKDYLENREDIIKNKSIAYGDLEVKQKVDYGQLLYLKKENSRGKIYTADINDAKYEVDNVLKTYMPYSARYIHGDPLVPMDYTDVTIIYTLDNYMTVQGNIKGLYYTKSGYLIVHGSVKYPDKSLGEFEENEARSYIKENEMTIEVGGITITSNGDYENRKKRLTDYQNKLDKAESLKRQILQGVIKGAEIDNQINSFSNEIGYNPTGASSYEKLENSINYLNDLKNDEQYEIDKILAVIYYVEADIFSGWVYSNLFQIDECDLVEISGQKYSSIKGSEHITYDFSTKHNPLFLINEIDDEIGEADTEFTPDSIFSAHKLNVIRNSIQYNLNAAMSAYNAISSSGMQNYSMPVLTSEEWEKITSNVSVVSFMQGYKCGLKIYNNYMIVSSTNNEISFVPEDVYFVKKEEFSDEISEYHKIDCPKLIDIDNKNLNCEYIAFTSKDVKYDKIYDKGDSVYKYDHKNYACYDCINDGNYPGTKTFSSAGNLNLRKAYYIGIGKCRYNLYKMNAVEHSQGYDVIFDKKRGIVSGKNTANLQNLKAVEIVLGTLKTDNIDETILRYQIGFNNPLTQNKKVYDQIYTIPTNLSTNYTLKVEFNESGTLPINMRNITAQIVSDDPSVDISLYEQKFKDAIQYIKVIYRN